MDRKASLEGIPEETGEDLSSEDISESENAVSDGETENGDDDQSNQSTQPSRDMLSVPSVNDILPDRASSDADEGNSESSEGYGEEGAGDHFIPPVRFSVQLRNRAEKVQRKSICSLQRSLVMCHEMDAFAKHTLTKLDAGAKTFQLMEDQQAEIEKDLVETTESMETMAKCCGGMCSWWGKNHPVEDAHDAPLPVSPPATLATIQPGAAVVDEEGNPAVQNIVLISDDRMELQMEYEMELLEGYVDQLEQMSADIARKVGSESRIMDDVTTRMDKNIIRVVLAQKKAKNTIEKG